MGNSLILHEKRPFELTIEIDKDISIEISTGFTSGDGPTTHINLPVTIEELGEIVKRLTSIYNDLKESWKCENCGCINNKDWEECNNCEKGKDETI